MNALGEVKKALYLCTFYQTVPLFSIANNKPRIIEVGHIRNEFESH